MSGRMRIEPSSIKVPLVRGNKSLKPTVLAAELIEGCDLISFRGQIEQPEYKHWIELEPDWVTFNNRHRSDTIMLTLYVPPEAVCQEHTIPILFSAEHDASNTTRVEVVVDVKHPLKMWLSENFWLVFAILAIIIIVIVLVLRWYFAGTGSDQQDSASVSVATLPAISFLSTTPTLEPTAGTQKFVNGIPFRWVSSGDFLTGNSDTVDYLPGLWIMETEVTNAQYAQCVETGPCSELSNASGIITTLAAEEPVRSVSWNQAAAFATWLGGCLPSEAEWEKACRGANKDPYPWGDRFQLDTTSAPKLANFRITFNPTRVAVVTDFQDGKSPFGVLNMLGNVWEWTRDEFRNNYGNSVRSYRGGAYNTGYESCADHPTYTVQADGTLITSGMLAPDDSRDNIGFRVVVTDDPQFVSTCSQPGS